jgi:hypothetical protein
MWAWRFQQFWHVLKRPLGIVSAILTAILFVIGLWEAVAHVVEGLPNWYDLVPAIMAPIAFVPWWAWGWLVTGIFAVSASSTACAAASGQARKLPPVG